LPWLEHRYTLHGDVSLDLREEWTDLLGRRPAFREALGLYTDLLELWSRWSAPASPASDLDEKSARQCWEGGEPLLAARPPSIRPEDLEDLLGFLMERLGERTPDAAPGLQRFAEGWDRGTISPSALLPAPGRIGTGAIEAASGLRPELVAFRAMGSLRPALDAHVAPYRAYLRGGDWRRGTCPFCGAPPGFADVLEDGQRRLCCHLCGGSWEFARARCPFCGTEDASDLARLELEDREQGYIVWGCSSCQGYIMELGRRVRWNGRSGLVEDWGSPHFDLTATRSSYWRPVPPLIGLAYVGRLPE
jgi:FdhE protein